MYEKPEKYTIKWTPKALETFKTITLQLIERWNIRVALSFDNKVKKVIDQLEQNPKIYPPSRTANLCKCVIHKNVSLIYRIRKNSVELIVFVDNRGQHMF